MSQESSVCARGLFVSYDGLLEPLGQSQILPYVIFLADSGVRMHVISFEKKVDRSDDVKRNLLEGQLRSHNVTWICLSYHARPKLLSTLFDVILGTWACLRVARRSRIQVVHARSFVPAVMTLPVKWLTGAFLVFDIRGFWPEERVQLGIFRAGGLMFRICKRLERLLWRHTDRLVVLTEQAKRVLVSLPEWRNRGNDISVIPCCVDLRRFPVRRPNDEIIEKYGLVDKHVVGNIGAVSTMYLLPEMFQFYAELKYHIPNVHFLYLTRQDPNSLYPSASDAGLTRNDLTVVEVASAEMPEWLSIFDLGIFFPRPSYATLAMSPTKLGEFLAAGVPVVTSAGVGDIADIVQPGTTGVLLNGFSTPELRAGATQATKFIPSSDKVRKACRKAAAEHFNLEKGCRRYQSLYRELIGTNLPVFRSLQRESV